MKNHGPTLYTIFVLACATTCQAQTWFYLTVTNFAGPDSIRPLAYSGTNIYEVGTNELVRVHGVYGQYSPGTGLIADIPGTGRGALPFAFQGAYEVGGSVVGPALIEFVAVVSTNNPPPIKTSVLLESMPVNGSAWAGASLVQPAGQGASLRVESSTNLTTWQTVTNATFPATNSNRFFRTTLTVQP